MTRDPKALMLSLNLSLNNAKAQIVLKLPALVIRSVWRCSLMEVLALGSLRAFEKARAKLLTPWRMISALLCFSALFRIPPEI